MKGIKRPVSLFAALVMLLSLSVPALASDYSDVSDGAWYAEAVAYVTEHKLMDAAAEGRFVPDENAPRSVVAEALWRLAGRPEAQSHAAFSDVTGSDPGRSAIDWAAEAGVINGYPDGRFGGKDLVTREQFSAMLWRAVGRPETDGSVSFADADTISAYAAGAAAWSQSSGVITGMPGGLFAPKATISRAMVATILMRYDRLQKGETESVSAGPKILVAYFSYTGGTEKIANHISGAVGADLYRIVPEEAYTDDILRYYDTSTRAYIEQNDDTARPAVSGTAEHMEDYDVVFVGYPIWYGKAPKIIYTFLESCDLTGKTVIPFCTSGSSDINNTELRSAAPGASWLNGHRFSSGASRDSVVSWINSLGLSVRAK